MTRGKHASSVVTQLRAEFADAMADARRREHDLIDRLARAEREAERARGLQERCETLEQLVADQASPELRRVNGLLAHAETQIEQLKSDGAWRQRLLDRAYDLIIPRSGYPSDAAYIEALAEKMGPDCNPRWPAGSVVHLDTPTQVAARLGDEAIKRIQRARRQR